MEQSSKMGGNEAFLDAYRTVRSHSAPPECSDGDRGATGKISLIWTPVMFWLDLLPTSFLLLLDGLAQSGCDVMCGISGKAKGKTGQKTRAA